MAMTKTESRSQTARARARQAMADELERARKRESKLVAVFSAIDARQNAEAALGRALVELRDLGVAQAELAGMTGLTAREVGSAIRSAKDGPLAGEDKTSDDHSSESHDSEGVEMSNDNAGQSSPEHAYN